LKNLISETIRGDTQTQVDTLKQVFNDLSDVMSSDSTEENNDKIYANLMISVKNLMSDQHIVNKNFLDEFTKLRTFLLEEFDTASKLQAVRILLIAALS
jgi:hypothetical protein